MSAIEALKLAAPPPVRPLFPGASEEWEQLEAEWRLEFPEDYKELVATYGAGHFADFFGVSDPFCISERLTPYREWVQLRLEGVERARRSYPEDAVPFAPYPEGGGLFPWGYTDNGGTMFWLTKGKNIDWPVVCLDVACSNRYDLFNLSATDFLQGWLTGRISVPSLTPPDFFPLPTPIFIQYQTAQ